MVNEQRLIDANEYPCNTCGISYCYKNCDKFNAWFEKTVDAVEVVHGHKVVRERHRGIAYAIECPICNGKIPSNNPYTEKVEYCSVCGKKLDDTFQNYCPNCGAKMDGGNEEE